MLRIFIVLCLLYALYKIGDYCYQAGLDVFVTLIALVLAVIGILNKQHEQ